MKKNSGKLTVAEINSWVWTEKWIGKIDRDALKERIEDLLDAEKELHELYDKLQSVRKLVKDIF